MTAKVDYTGITYGLLTALRPADQKRRGHIVWEMQCTCGAIVIRKPAELAARVRRLESPRCSSCRGVLAHKSEDEKIEYRREWKRVYDSRSEVIAKRNSPAAKAKRKEYDARPTSIEAHRVFDALASSKAKRYERVYGVRFIDALPWFEILVENRTCWLCREKISGHMHLDHDHSALTVRGWTHPTCNQMEGMANKSPNPYRLLKTLLDLTAQGD